MKKYILFLVACILFLNGCVLNMQKKENASTPDSNLGITDDTILLGTSAALTGHTGYLGSNYLKGAQAFFDEINDEGGVNGRKIKVVSYDDEYDPSTCLANTQKLINEDKVFALVNFVGTPTSAKIIPIVNEANIPLVGVFSGANILREPLNKYIFNIRVSYYLETSRTVKHFVDDLGLRKIAIFYQNDAYGLDGLTGAELALAGKGLKPIARASYVRGTLDVENAVETIRNSGADAIIMVGTYSPSAKFIKLARSKEFSPVFDSVSFVGADEFKNELGDAGEGVIISQVVPDDLGLMGDKHYAEAMDKYFKGDVHSSVGLEGFINAEIIVEGLRRAGDKPTRKKFIEALESIQNYDVGIGHNITFSKDRHEGLDFVFFTIIENNEFKFINDWGEIRRKLNSLNFK
jgi:branched-chain amino acid transport system substrate-binding protein